MIFTEAVYLRNRSVALESAMHKCMAESGRLFDFFNAGARQKEPSLP